jgi:hypothetical protein
MLDLVNLSWFVYKIRRCDFRGLFRACFWCLCSWCDSADLSGFLPDFFEGNMDGCLVHLCD